MTITIGKNTVIVAAYLATCIYIYKRYDRFLKNCEEANEALLAIRAKSNDTYTECIKKPVEA